MKPHKLILGIWVCMCTLSSCIEKKDLYNEDYVNAVIEASFDYSLTLECPITLTYERRALIKIYDANPVNNPGARLLYGAYTDDNGNYNGTIVLPKQYLNKELYAYSKNIGVTYLLKSKVKSDGLHFKVPESQARGIAQAPQHIPEILKQAVESELPEETDNRSKLSENNDINIKLTKDCSVDVIFIWSGAGTDWWTGMYNDDIANCQRAEDNNQWVNNDFSCDLYYFTYKEGELPTKEYIDTHIVGNSWQYVAWGANQTTVSWNGTVMRITLDDYVTTTLPAGTCIGWVLTHPRYTFKNKWDTSAPEEKIPYLYSIPEYNPGGYSQSIRYQYGSGDEKVFLYGMEDVPIGKPIKVYGEKWEEHQMHSEGNTATTPYFYLASDYDYNDVLFMVKASVENAIEDTTVPELPESKPVYSYETDEGTLLYEDLYPYQGDYDMNDVVVQYKLAKHFDQNNKLIKIEYSFTPIWDGAEYMSDFSFMIDGIITTPVKVFNNHKNCLNQTFKGELTGSEIVGLDKDALKWSDFNPFIYVHDTGKEVHLTKKNPSPDANIGGLSEVLKKYVNDQNYPFAMKIPTLDYKIVTEMVRIDEEYPNYQKWVESDGSIATDWYLNKVDKE